MVLTFLSRNISVSAPKVLQFQGFGFQLYANALYCQYVTIIRLSFYDLIPFSDILSVSVSEKASYLKNFQSNYLEYQIGDSFETFVTRLKERFSLIIIAEYFDESLIVLRRKFCWKFTDIIYTVLRARNYKNKNVIPSEQAMNTHRNYSAVDYEIYEYFVTELMNSIRLEDRFWEEFYVFKNIKENVQLYCDGVLERIKRDATLIYKLVENDEKEDFDPAPWGELFSVSAVDCAVMKLRTIVHRNLMKLRQFPELCRYKIKRTVPILKGITWHVYGESLIMHPAYCDSPVVDGISLKVLAQQSSYMWT